VKKYIHNNRVPQPGVHSNRIANDFFVAMQRAPPTRISLNRCCDGGSKNNRQSSTYRFRNPLWNSSRYEPNKTPQTMSRTHVRKFCALIFGNLC
jgi:hypothetical protein